MRTCRKGHEIPPDHKRCRPCYKAMMAAYYATHREEMLAGCSRRRDLAAERERSAKYRRKDLPGFNARVREWREKNAERDRANRERWRHENRDAVRETHRRRKTRVRAAVALHGHHTAEEWQALVQRHEGKCAHCGERRPLTRDHIIPVSRGGGDTIDNIQPLCRPCNSRKGARVVA